MNDDTRGDGARRSAPGSASCAGSPSCSATSSAPRSSRGASSRRRTARSCAAIARVPRRHRGALRGPHRALKGDGALSMFGFPLAHENDAERAVRAGLALVQAVRELSGDGRRGRVARRPRRRPPRPRLPRPRRGGHLRAGRQRRRAASVPRRPRHGRDLRGGPPLVEDRFDVEAVRAADRQGRRRAARSHFRVVGERRPDPADVGDPARRAR